MKIDGNIRYTLPSGYQVELPEYSSQTANLAETTDERVYIPHSANTTTRVDFDINEYTSSSILYGFDGLAQVLAVTQVETGETGENYAYGVNRLGYLYDGRGSNAEFRYDPFGAIQSDIGQEPVFGYNGESYNPATELQYLRARYYDSSTANFTTQDGFFGETQIPTSFNRYSYAFNDPINLSDPTGEFPSFGNFLNGAKNALKSLVNGGKNTINSIVDIAKKVFGFHKNLALDIVSALKKKFIDPIIISELKALLPETAWDLAKTKVNHDNESDENKKSALRTRFLELEARHRELCDQARKVGLQPDDIGYTIDTPNDDLPWNREIIESGYVSADEAAIAWAEQIYATSLYIRREYGGEIYSRMAGNTKVFFFTNPRVGEQHSVSAGIENVPADSKFEAVVHTHPNSNSFSGMRENAEKGDIPNANRQGINVYVVGPNLNLQRYNVSDGTITVVRRISPIALTDAQRTSLVAEHRASWEEHIVSCDRCRQMQWPTS